jgi:AraC-like DNA-binding protein
MRVMEITTTDIERARLAASIMEQCLRSHFPISQLAAKVMLPEKRLKAVFKQLYGQGLYAYLRQARMERAKALLLEGKPIKVIIHVIGFDNESNFCKAFRNMHQVSPKTWKQTEMRKGVTLQGIQSTPP